MATVLIDPEAKPTVLIDPETTRQEIAAYFGVSDRTVRRWAARCAENNQDYLLDCPNYDHRHAELTEYQEWLLYQVLANRHQKTETIVKGLIFYWSKELWLASISSNSQAHTSPKN
jgi:hypothetical protein